MLVVHIAQRIAGATFLDPWLHASFGVAGAYIGSQLQDWEDSLRAKVDAKLEEKKRRKQATNN